MKDPDEHNKANQHKWDRRAQTYDKKRFDYFRFMQKKVIAQIAIKEKMCFLDLGCGTGWAVRYVASLVNGHGKFFGIDISDGMIEKAKDNSQGLENIKFLKANAEELPFENDFFDNIICTNSFHHYLNPDKVMSEIHRVLKNKGKIYILDVNSDDFFISWINKKVKKREKVHVNFYSSIDYRNMFSKSGLKPVKRKKLMYPLKLHIAEK